MTMNHHFVVCLLPSFLQFAFYYWFVADRGSVPYAHQLVRQTLDVYRCGGGSGDRSNSSTYSTARRGVLSRRLTCHKALLTRS
jgi:hypothetical protein